MKWKEGRKALTPTKQLIHPNHNPSSPHQMLQQNKMGSTIPECQNCSQVSPCHFVASQNTTKLPKYYKKKSTKFLFNCPNFPK
jgi:hypothetical protein